EAKALKLESELIDLRGKQENFAAQGRSSERRMTRSTRRRRIREHRRQVVPRRGKISRKSF
ncbi:hypothetical protein A2U01_0082396, partial [Trifolium medium]|nr:hypothetical protein [Trifolium medium]